MKIAFTISVLLPLVSSLCIAQSTQSSVLPNTNGFTLRALRNTVSSAILNNLKLSDLKINQGLVPARKNTQTQFSRSFSVNFKISDDSDQLVVYIPGFGGQADSGHAKFLIELLSRNGFSAVSLDSPASYRFITQSSYYGVPGIQEFDTEDIYEGIIRTKAYLESLRLGKRYSKVSVIGGSLGGYNASQLALLANEKQELPLHRIIAMNPPISNVYGLTLVDYLSQNYRKQIRQDLHSVGIINHVDTLIRAFLNKLKFSVKFDQVASRTANVIDPEIPLTKDDLIYLMGYEFSEMIDKAIEAAQLRNNNRVKMTTKTFYGIFNSFSLAYSSLLKIDPIPQFVGPIFNSNSNLLSKIRKDTPTKFLERKDDIALEASSIEFNLAKLAQVKNFVILTTEDDFLLRIPTASDAFGVPASGVNDSLWIRRNFNGKYDPVTRSSTKARSYVFSEGGHLGGLPFNSIQKTLLKVLSED